MTCPHLTCTDRDACALCGEPTCPDTGVVCIGCNTLLCGCGRCPECGWSS